MPTKAEQYAQMADQVARQLTGSWQEWAGIAMSVRLPLRKTVICFASRNLSKSKSAADNGFPSAVK